MNYPAYPELLSPALFFTLKETEEWVPLITPIVHNHQPHGFRDSLGQLWLGVLTKDGLRRQKVETPVSSQTPVKVASPQPACAETTP